MVIYTSRFSSNAAQISRESYLHSSVLRLSARITSTFLLVDFFLILPARHEHKKIMMWLQYPSVFLTAILTPTKEKQAPFSRIAWAQFYL